MNVDTAEAYRRAELAKQYLIRYPAKASILKAKIESQIVGAFLYGYHQACQDLLSPKETPGTPATAITLLNRIGEIVLKTRRELLQQDNRVQCAGCFCMLTEPALAVGWCDACLPHRTRLAEQCDALQQSQEDANIRGT